MTFTRKLILAAIVIAVQLAVAGMIRIGDLRGGLLVFIAFPAILVATWLVFVFTFLVLLRKPAMPKAAGYALLLALLSATIPVMRLFMSGPYGPGP